MSYVRGTTKDRFDYVFVSEKITVESCSYDYKGAVDVGSNHAIVSATLTLP